jgi:hypothetical protein
LIVSLRGKNQAVGPPAGAVAAPIAASTQRRPRLLQKLPNDILALQSKRHLNLVATTGYFNVEHEVLAQRSFGLCVQVNIPARHLAVW